MPVRGPRRVYGIPNLIRRKDSEGDLVYQTGLVKIKVPIANALELDSLALADEDLYQTVTRGGITYTVRRGLGGFRVKAWTLVAKTNFDITEIVYTTGNPVPEEVQSQFRTISIGMPAGVSTNRFCRFILLSSGDLKDQVDFIVTPDGARGELAYIAES